MANLDLAIVTCYFNPADYQIKRKLFAECKQRIPDLFTVECLFDGKLSEIDSDIQVHGDILWQKERLLNIAIQNRLAAGYKNVCWIDFDCEFIDTDWRYNILEALETKDIVQCFSTFTCKYTDKQVQGESILVLYSDMPRLDGRASANGGAWAASARLLSTGFLLYDKHIAGAGDSILIWLLRHSMNGRMPNMNYVCRWNKKLEDSVKSWIVQNSDNVRNSWAFSKNNVEFHSHGRNSDRKYEDLNISQSRYEFDPENDIKESESGALIWTDTVKPELRNIIKDYFSDRKEDS